MDTEANPQSIHLKLSKQEALVLFEWLANADSADTARLQHPAEEKVLWKLQARLESTLAEPFAADYANLLAQARATVEAGDE